MKLTPELNSATKVTPRAELRQRNQLTTVAIAQRTVRSIQFATFTTKPIHSLSLFNLPFQSEFCFKTTDTVPKCAILFLSIYQCGSSVQHKPLQLN